MRSAAALLFVGVIAFGLAACAGSGGSGSITSPVNPVTPQSSAEQQLGSVATANAAGAPVEDMGAFEIAVGDPLDVQFGPLQTASVATASTASPTATASPGATATPKPIVPPPNGTCIPNFFGSGPYQGFEYRKPDKAGDPNSVEYQYFYDTACTQLAKDRIRVVSSLVGSGTIKTQTHTVTTSDYDKGVAAPVSVGTEVNTITGQFSSEGYPILKAGFLRTSLYSLSKGTTLVLNRASESIASPSTSVATTYCGDSAGFSTTPLQTTAQIHGWQNLRASAVRTVNADGSVTWASSSSGSVYSATPPATFTINKGTLNTACPITVPAFTLLGGKLSSSYSIPSMSVTYKNGLLLNLTVINETLANGYTLNITTNSSVLPTSQSFINGTIANAGKTIATFSVDANGNGTLTVTATGTVYTITHWHVVKG